MSTEDRAILAKAAELHRQLARAARVARGNGLGYAVFGGLSLALALTDLDALGLLVGAILLGVGLFERQQAVRMLQASVDAPVRLARGELVLLGAIVLYGVLGLTVLPSPADALQKQLGSTAGLGVDLRRLAESVSTVWYTAVIAIAVLYQGGMARYFLNRRAAIDRYRQATPSWAREVVEAMAD